MLGGVTHIPFSMEGLDYLENTLFRANLPPEEVAAVDPTAVRTLVAASLGIVLRASLSRR